MRIRITLVLLLIVTSTLSGLLACAARPERCWVCDREIHAGVVATITLADGRQVHACCPRCALHYQEEPGNEVRRITVTDFAGGGVVPFASAYFVEGSDETPCLHHPPLVDETRNPLRICYDRCMPSLVAFRSADAARAFMADHGGTLLAPGALPGAPR